MNLNIIIIGSDGNRLELEGNHFTLSIKLEFPYPGEGLELFYASSMMTTQ